MKISSCKGATIYFALTKEGKITYSLHYKGEGVWVNSEEDLIRRIRQIAVVKLHGEQYKTWQVGKEGWRKDVPEE